MRSHGAAEEPGRAEKPADRRRRPRRPATRIHRGTLLYELTPVVLRDETAAAQNAVFVARQAALYRSILEQGAHSGDFRLVAPPQVLARGFVALEAGYGLDVLTGASTADQVEEWLLLHADVVTGGACRVSGTGGAGGRGGKGEM